MRVLVIQLWPKFETCLELVQDHLDRGDEVAFLGCAGELVGCWLNYQHAAAVCARCASVRDLALGLTSPRLRFQTFLKLECTDRAELRELYAREFLTLDDLKAFRLDGFDVGMAVASGLITNERNPHVDVLVHRESVRRSVVSSWAVYRSVQNHLKASPYDRVYVANARGAETRGVLRACQGLGATCMVHESGHDKDHYELFENVLPHDLGNAERKIRQAWDAAAADVRVRAAEKWYRQRAGSAGLAEVSFVGGQRSGLLPAGFDRGRRNLVIFNSSEDEFAALEEEWNNPLYADQLDGLRRIRASLASADDAPQVYLRMHPNLRGVDNAQVRALTALRGPGFDVIPPESPVSTYDLMRAANAVLTFGSTTGIEAVFWGTPSILAGKCSYRNLGGTYNPASHEEVVDLVRRPLPPGDREAALKYGHYMATFGLPFRHYRASRPMTTHFVVPGAFEGRRLQPSTWVHYQWALLHRIAPLRRWLDRCNLEKSEQALGLNETRPVFASLPVVQGDSLAAR